MLRYARCSWRDICKTVQGFNTPDKLIVPLRVDYGRIVVRRSGLKLSTHETWYLRRRIIKVEQCLNLVTIVVGS